MQQAFGILFFVVLCASANGQNQNKPNGTLSFYSGVPSGRIVNGQTVSIQNFPFIVGLRVNDAQICGGSIITAKHVVSAAHCLANRPAFSSVMLHAGSTSQYSGGYLFPVSSYVIHPNYNPVTIDFDAAVITTSISFGGYPNVMGIALQETEIAPTWCYAIGWGAINGATQQTPENLQFTWLQSMSTASCSNVYGAGRITPQMLCAQYATYDTCQGDSGGPLVCNGRLTGIVSFGVAGCQGKYPAVLGKIVSSSIRSFIRQYAGI